MMTGHVDPRMVQDNAREEGLPNAPMAMPEQQLERSRVGFGLHLLFMPARAVPLRVRAWSRVR